MTSLQPIDRDARIALVTASLSVTGGITGFLLSGIGLRILARRT